MKLEKNKIIPVVALSVFAVIGLVGIGSVFADSDDSNKDSRPQRIAEHFNLDLDSVNGFFEEERTIHQAEMQQRQAEKLAQLVTDGKITEDQKTAIASKYDEMRSEREEDRVEKGEMRDMTFEERKAERAERVIERGSRHAEMDSWLEENNIGKDLLPALGLGSFGGRHGGFGGGNRK